MKPNKVPPTPKQTGHGPTHKGNDAEQAAHHNRDMARIEKLNRRGLEK